MDHLDMEYLQTLRLIKPYIPCIMNNEYIEMIKLWLEKLSDEGGLDKATRNLFLTHLGKQIERGELEEPFTTPPPKDALSPGNVFNQLKVANFQSYHSPAFQLADKKDGYRGREEQARSTFNTGKLARKKLCTRFLGDSKDHALCTDQEKSGETDSSWQDLSDEVESADGASGDVGGTHELDHGDAFQNALYTNKIKDLVAIIERLQYENSTLNHIVDGYGKELTDEPKQDLNGIVAEVETLKGRLNELLDVKTALQDSHFSVAAEWQAEVSALQNKLAVVQKKNCELKNLICTLENKLQDAQKLSSTGSQKCAILTEMYKKEVDLLKQKHRDEVDRLEVHQTEILNNHSAELEAKFEELKTWYETRVEEMQAETKKNLHEFYEKQVEEVREEMEAEMKAYCERRDAEVAEEKRQELELAYKDKLSSLEGEESRLRAFHDAQLEEQRAEFLKELKFKDSEIARLEELLQEQCRRMQVEVQTIREQMDNSTEGVATEKNDFLQKCIVKMDKLYKRAEREFSRQIIKLRKEMEIKDKHNQILLSTQRVQLISSNTISKQKEIDEIVFNLEHQYKKLLIEHQTQAMKEKRESSRTITELRAELVQIKAGI